jgi:hypothetical protein
MKIDTDTEEGKAKLQEMIDDATKGLKSKNDELLGELKKQKDATKSIQEQIDEINAAKEAAEEEAAKKAGDVEKLVANAVAKKDKEIDGLKSQLDQQTVRLNQTLIDKGLSDALVKANVAAHHIPAVTALIKATAKSEIADQEGSAVAMFDGKPIDEFVQGWAQGDTGKHYIAAPNNGGGGAGGSNGGGKAPGGKKADWDSKKKSEFIREHGREAYQNHP